MYKINQQNGAGNQSKKRVLLFIKFVRCLFNNLNVEIIS